MGHLDGQLRQRWWLLPLFLRRGPRLRPHGAVRHLRPGLSSARRGARLRHPATAEEDPPRHQFRREQAGNAWMSGMTADFIAALRARFEGALVGVTEPRGEVTLDVEPAQWLGAALALRDEFVLDQ